MVRTKQNASYWLGLIAFDAGDYRIASDYFEIRSLATDPGSIWAPGARYNLGRCEEAIGWRDRDEERVAAGRADVSGGGRVSADCGLSCPRPTSGPGLEQGLSSWAEESTLVE